MVLKCVHKGCGKTYENEDEVCIYHAGPPVFHEGQKGWKCCKPRVLTFDEFLAIPPCTTGKHSTVDDIPAAEPDRKVDKSDENTVPIETTESKSEVPIPAPRLPQSVPAQARQETPAPPVESDSDDPETPIPENSTCKRRGCGGSSSKSVGQKCVYHPGHPIFHEGSKGWTCCKRRVLEFDEFMKIPGCKTREKHCFVGKSKAKAATSGGDAYEKLATVRHDFYQTGATLHVSLYLKKIDKDKSKIEFSPSGTEIDLHLRTLDGKEYAVLLPLYGKIKSAESSFKVMGTKLDLTLAKADASGWPVLRSDEKLTGEIIQTGSAGRA